jgi:hypothetical protein
MEPSPKQWLFPALALVPARRGEFIPQVVFRLALTVILFFVAATPLPAATVNLRDGSPVRLKLRHLLTTESVTKGDKIQFEVVEDVVAFDRVVIVKGAPASASITQVKGAGNKKAKDASVAFRVLSVRAVNSQEISLRLAPQKSKEPTPTDYDVEERSAIPGLAERTVGVEQGREYTAYTDGDVRVTVADAPTLPAAPPVAAPAPPVVEPAEPAIVNVNSEPSGATIVIDGEAAGQSPATLPLAPGRHAIELRLANYRPWTRSMMVTPGSHPSIRAALESE